MISSIPPLTPADEIVLEEIENLRSELRFYLYKLRWWYGTLRRARFARAVQGSNSIEGCHASVEDVAAVIADEEPLDADEETLQAISGYRDAMTYVMHLAPTEPLIDASLIRSLHFMMIKYDLPKHWTVATGRRLEERRSRRHRVRSARSKWAGWSGCRAVGSLDGPRLASQG